MGFLTIDFGKGQVRGASKHPGYEGKVEFLSVSVGEPGTQGPGGRTRRESGRDEAPRPMRITMTRYVDEASPAFMKAFVDGKLVKSARLELVRAGDDGKLATYFELEFSGGVVTSHQIGSQKGVPVEVIEFELDRKSKPKQSPELETS